MVKSGAMGWPGAGQPIGIVVGVEALSDEHPLPNPPGMAASVMVLQLVMRTGRNGICDGRL
jgi:hypothetical protein